MSKKAKPKAEKFKCPYKPTPFQQKISDAISDPKVKVICLVAGIRAGKTLWALIEALKQIYVHKKQPPLGWIISPTFPMSMAPERLFERICSEIGDIILQKRVGDRAYIMRSPPEYKQPFRIEFKTADVPDRLRGVSLAFAIMDEGAMMKPDVFQILLGRVLDSKGKIIIPTTPKGMNWLYHDVYLKSLDDPRYVVIQAKTEENYHLDESEVADLRSRYTKANAQQELNADFVSHEGRVFSEFNTTTHLIPMNTEIPEPLPVYCGIDWGYNDPFSCQFFVKWDGVWIGVDEYYKSKGLIEEHVTYLKSHPLWHRVKRVWADPSGLQNRKEFMARQIRAIPARRNKKSSNRHWNVERAEVMNTLFSKRMTCPWNPKITVPGLVFMDHMTNTIREFDGLSYKRSLDAALVTCKHCSGVGDIGPSSPCRNCDGTGKVAGRSIVLDSLGRESNRNAGEEIEDKNNHSVDASGYVLFSEVRPFTMSAGFVPGVDTKEAKKAKAKTPEDLLMEEWRAIYKAADEQLKRRSRPYDDVWDTMSGM